MSLSPQVQKLCQQAEQEKDFRKLLLLVSQIIHSVSHNFVENEGTERDILQYICQIKSFAANLTVEIMVGQFLVCGDSSLSRIMPMFSTFQQPRSRQSCLKRQHKISLSEL